MVTHTHSWILLVKRIGRRKQPHLINGEKVYICSRPDCNSFKPKSLIINKVSACPQCGKEFVLNAKNLKLAVPKCEFCRRTKKGRELKRAQELLSEIPQIYEEELNG